MYFFLYSESIELVDHFCCFDKILFGIDGIREIWDYCAKCWVFFCCVLMILWFYL